MCDELSHLVAGLSYCELDSFDLYPVNPPLSKLVAAIPVHLQTPNYNWQRLDLRTGVRSEGAVAEAFVKENPTRIFRFLLTGRLTCIIFSLAGAVVCAVWANDLYGYRPAIAAMTLWCLSPTVITSGSTINADTAGAAMGVLACYTFYRWTRYPTWSNTFVSGMTLGFAELAKSTWVILAAAYPIIWLLTRRNPGRLLPARRELSKLVSMAVLAIAVLNAGYGFDRSLETLGSYNFASTFLGSGSTDTAAANRFRDSCLETALVPFPHSYITGIDLQKRDFERGIPVYVNGRYRDSCWYYYLYSAAVKIPVALHMLAMLAFGSAIRNRNQHTRWRTEVPLLVPPLALFVFISLNTTVCCFRYMLPCLPFAFIWVSRMFRRSNTVGRTQQKLTVGLMTWFVVSGLHVYPHSISHFNEFGGGPRRGHHLLAGASVDQGQDLFRLRRWQEKNPNLTPTATALVSGIDLRWFDISSTPPPRKRRPDRSTPKVNATKDDSHFGPLPGYYAVSVDRLHDPDGAFSYFAEFTPAARIGYSVNIYIITEQVANDIRRKTGLAPVGRTQPSSHQPAASR